MTAQLIKQTKVITGNAAAAYGAMLCRPDVVAAYPITPQSELIEQLAKFHAEGILTASMSPLKEKIRPRTWCVGPVWPVVVCLRPHPLTDWFICMMPFSTRPGTGLRW